MRERDRPDWTWVAIVVVGAALFSLGIVLSVVGAEDPIHGVRAAAVGVFAGVGIVALTTDGLARLYRTRPRVWITISPRPWMVIALGVAFYLLAVDWSHEPLRYGYLLGGMLWMQAVYSRWRRQQENDLREILSDPDDELPAP